MLYNRTMLYVTQLLELFARSLTMEKKKKMKNWVKNYILQEKAGVMLQITVM